MLCLAIGSLSAAAQKTYAWLTDTSTGSPLQVEAASYTTGNVIVLDAGHGGYDTGSISYDGVYEKDITLAITQKIGEQLEKAGYTVVYTRTSDEVIWSNDNRDDLRTALPLERKQERIIIFPYIPMPVNTGMVPAALKPISIMKMIRLQPWRSPLSRS